MAKSMLFSVYDSKAEMHSPPMADRSIQSAIRRFTSEVASPESQLHHYPEDFALYNIGTFDDETGEVHVNGRHLIKEAAAVARELSAASGGDNGEA